MPKLRAALDAPLNKNVRAGRHDENRERGLMITGAAIEVQRNSGQPRAIRLSSFNRPVSQELLARDLTAWRGVFEVRQEMSRWDVENPRAASSPE